MRIGASRDHCAGSSSAGPGKRHFALALLFCLPACKVFLKVTFFAAANMIPNEAWPSRLSISVILTLATCRCSGRFFEHAVLDLLSLGWHHGLWWCSSETWQAEG